MPGHRHAIAVIVTTALALTASAAAAQSAGPRADRAYRAPTITRGSPARPLTAAAHGSPVDRAKDYVRAHGRQWGLTEADVLDLAVTGESRSAHTGISHVFLRQRIDGIEVFGADANVNVAADGRVLSVGYSFLPDVAPAVNRSTPALGAAAAAEAAARHVGLDPEALMATEARAGPEQETILTDGGIATGPITVKLVYQPVDARELRLAWQVDLEERSGQHLWRMTVDAETGEVLNQEDYTMHDNWDAPGESDGTSFESFRRLREVRGYAGTAGGPLVPSSPTPVIDGSSYRVFAHPKESPNDGPRTLVTNPADADASPFGWHDTNGAVGPEFTIARGNNVHAYLDQDANNNPDFGEPDGGPGLTFDFPVDLNEHAQNYRAAVVTNLFYWNNIFHDVMWRYGFNEPSGNFQANNYGRGGGQGDYVRAEAADGGGTNNANFSTPAADAGTPRMQMFLWPGAQFGPQNEVVAGGVSYGSSWARFGPAPTPAGVSGQMFDAGTGCNAAAYAGAPAGDWIAIVTGSNSGCQNIEKARQAGLAGAKGIVVALNAGGAAPILTGSLTTAGPTIPAASVTQADGNAIRAAIAGGPVAGTIRKHPSHPGIRDGDFEAGIIIHEFGHGVSLRLTGGPGINCLSGDEQAGEGWSDYFAITVLLDPALDDPEGPRGMGPYALFQDSRQGAGIRPRPYSRNMTIQPFTYDSIKTGAWLNGTSLSVPHGIGHGWASVLWDTNWDLIDKHGFHADVYAPWYTGGNNRALQYVTDGLKLQGCSPGLVASRNGILAATEALGGEDTCTVWASFARRGLGFSAVQGTTNRNNNDEAFDTHPDCRQGFQAPVTAPYGVLNVRDAGSAVPLKFFVGKGLGPNILASNSPFSRKVDCDTLRVPSIGEFITPREYPEATATPGNSGLSYNAQGVYHYNWKTLQEWAGTCREVVVTRKDGIQHRAFFRFVAP
jgi:extracellular elastinolytic metalloproteinase